MSGSVCIVAICLLAVPGEPRCAADAGAMVDHRRVLDWRDTADLPAHPFLSRERRACRRYAESLPIPANARIVTIDLAPAPQTQQATAP